MLIYFASGVTILIFSVGNLKRARPVLIHLVSFTCKLALKIFGAKVIVKGNIETKDKNFLIVSNHLSYLDILSISSLFPTCFVTSKEMKETPFLGQLCHMGGCLFVERRSRAGLSDEVSELAGALESGLNVVIFPEATSTNGEDVIRFKRPLFQSALNAKSMVLPLCLNYKTLDNEKITLKNRDLLFWYGDMGFGPHALKLLSRKNIVIELNILPAFSAGDFPGKNELTQHTFVAIHSHYEKII
jgi:1-acyl-sn-glycerol-3-phosphate acyltransferase